ncbi:polyphosphate polymerase domain-containing protein [Candidatus Saccharibacteria bacterium]|nr:polyphosphate polymerase domain-containing protein [Candidatus Saccharibacteria bacterium]
MDDKTIERIEEKYLITSKEKTELLKAIKSNLRKDEFFSEEVLSIYFDTKNYDLVIKSIDRPDFREKVRIRAYNVPKLSSPIFFEIKTKLKVGKKKIGNKRRLSLPLKDFYQYLEKDANLEELAKNFSKNNKKQVQIARELDYLMKYYRLEPKLFIGADRVAYVGKDDSNFRLTFDSNLRFREKKLRLEKGSDGEKFFPLTSDPKHDIIMEVKTMNAMPPWFARELSRLKIYPVRFSKYGKIYELIKERNKNV